MTKILITALLFILTGSVTGYSKKKPTYPRADIMVSYNYHEEHLKTDAKAYVTEVPMVLLTNGNNSKFYNLKHEYFDSLRATPSGKKLWREMMNAAAIKAVETGNFDDVPAAPIQLYVFKSVKDSTLTVFDTDGSSGSYYYTEPLGTMQWQISDSTKTILGYECIKAETDFRGRHWTAWFSPDIPVQDGPWKLCGLPGLILEASEVSGQHMFTANGIKKSSAEMLPVYNKKKYEKVKRIDALKSLRKYLLKGDTMSMMLIQNTPDGSKIDMPEPSHNENPDLYVDFLETDYH